MKIGRNDPCHCGSGKKYKKCCMAQDEVNQQKEREEREAHRCQTSEFDLLLDEYIKEKKQTKKGSKQKATPEQEVDVYQASWQQLVENGYREFEARDASKTGCNLWWLAWQKLKPLIPDHNTLNVQELDQRLNTSPLLYNWCQDFENRLANTMRDNWLHAFRRIEFAQEFISLLPQSDLLIIQNMRRAIGEAYSILGKREVSEQSFKQLVSDYPEWAWGYIGWGDMLWMDVPEEKRDYTRALSIYQQGLTIAIEDISALQERIDMVNEEAKIDMNQNSTPFVDKANVPIPMVPILLEEYEQWQRVYNEQCPSNQYQMLLDALKKPLPADDEEVDEILCEAYSVMLELLLKDNRLEELDSLLEQMSKKWPDFYDLHFIEYEDYLVHRYLTLKDPERLKSVLQRIKQQPGPYIDQLLPTLSLLICYEQDELALDLAESTFQEINEADDLISGAEYPLAQAVWANRLEKAYRQFISGGRVDWQAFADAVSPYNFNIKQDYYAEIETLWASKRPQETGRQFWNTDSRKWVQWLSNAFLQYMLETRGKSFMFSFLIWSQYEELFYKGIAWEKKDDAQSVFNIPGNYLEETIINLMGLRMFGLSNKKPSAMALVWGMHYIYDFLAAYGLIVEELHQQMYMKIFLLKEQLKDVIADSLWNYSFVTAWQDNRMSEQERTLEAEIFSYSMNGQSEASFGDISLWRQ